MKILMYGFSNEAVKEDVKKFIVENGIGSDSDSGLKVKSIRSRNGNLKGFTVYRIGSSSKIYEVDGINMKSYEVHRGKVTAEYQILTNHNTNLFEYWKSL